VASAVTTGNGEFNVGGAPSGRYALTATAPGHLPASQEIELNARLSLVNQAGAEVAAAATDAGGQYFFSNVLSGHYTIVASGYRPRVAALPAGDGRPRQADITLARPE
jgi:hypothetical protein